MTPKELKHIAPKLAALQQKGTGMKLPKGYLETLEDNVLFQLQSVKNNAFDVPKDYFDTIEDKVFRKLNLKKKQKVFTLKTYWKPMLVAASLALLFLLHKPSENADIDAIAISDIESWIEDGSVDISTFEIVMLLDDTIELEETTNNIDEESIEEYLLQEVSEDFFYN